MYGPSKPTKQNVINVYIIIFKYLFIYFLLHETNGNLQGNK